MGERLTLPGKAIALAAVLTLPACDRAEMTPSFDEEMAKIAALHERDEAASRNGDFGMLRSLLSDDAVLMPPGEHWVRGSAALDAKYELMAGAMRAIEVTEYSLDFEEVVVSGDYAFEWGTVRGTTRNVAGESSSPDESSAYKVLRVLRKNPEGRWRVHRAMWNAMPPE